MPDIKNQLPNAQKLPVKLKRILAKLFEGYQTVRVLDQYTAGQSGAGVYRVRAVTQQGNAELPIIVKIDEYPAIQQEIDAYEEYIRGRLPQHANIERGPAYIPGKDHGGIAYTLAGEGIKQITSLSEFLQNASIADIELVLKDVFSIFGSIWRQSKSEKDYHYRDSFDQFLPANLTIDKTTDGLTHNQIVPRNAHNSEQSWRIGERVQIRLFTIVEQALADQRLELTAPEDDYLNFRISLRNVADVKEYKLWEKMSKPLPGIITDTRESYLRERIISTLDEQILLKKKFEVTKGVILENPFFKYDELLNKSHDVKSATIHGDLHFHNIIVSDDKRITIIDFGKSREDLVLRDLIHMELTVITDLLGSSFNEPVSPQDVYRFYKLLDTNDQSELKDLSPAQRRALASICLIRNMVRDYLYDSEKWDAYFDGLCLTLFGAMKYKQKDIRIPQTLFWAAATHLSLRKQPSTFVIEMLKAIEDSELSTDSKPIDSHLSQPFREPASVYNLDILFTQTDKPGRYQIHIIESPSGQTKEPSDQTLDSSEIDKLLVYTENLLAVLGDMKELGKKLHEFLFPPTIKTIFDKSYGRLRNNDLLRIRLRWADFTVMDELARLPWEYIHDGENFLALDRKLSIVRYHHGQRPSQLAVPDTLRVLFVTSGPRNLPVLDLEAELNAFKQVVDTHQVWNIKYHHLENKTLQELRSAIDDFRPHVLHFAGHGRRGEKIGELFLCDEKQNAFPLSAEDLHIMLEGGSVRIAILNGCDTTASPVTNAAIYSVAGQLVDAGLPAVIGMQYKLPDKIAPIFLTDLYTAIANNLPLDQAMTRTRIGLYVDWEDKNYWALPTLFLREDDGRIFRPH